MNALIEENTKSGAAGVAGNPRPEAPATRIALLTGGGDRHYAFGLATALTAEGVDVDFIGGDEVDSPELHADPRLAYYHLRESGQQAGAIRKIARVIAYYTRLLRYAASSRAPVFHILWNNRFELFDRTLLMLYYRALGKKVVFTAHNVNAAIRDSRDTAVNHWTLKVQYALANQIFVHTEKMRDELVADFGVDAAKITVIPYGINNALPVTQLTPAEAKRRLGVQPGEKTMLFFGNLAPYKGLEYLVAAVEKLLQRAGDYRLLIAGRAKKGCEVYVKGITDSLARDIFRGRVTARIELIPDEEVEIYFKAADVAVLPYTHIFQSGILFMGFSFGLPAIVSDVGCLRSEIVEGENGFVCRPRDSEDLAAALERYFAGDLYRRLESRRPLIQEEAAARHSWRTVGRITREVYDSLFRPPVRNVPSA